MFRAASRDKVPVKVPFSKLVLYETKPDQPEKKKKAVKSLLNPLGWQELIGAILV